MKVITLTNEYKLYNYANGWTLEYISTVSKMVKSVKTGEMVESFDSWKKYYGNLYSALKGFSQYYYEDSGSIDEVIQRVKEARGIIKDSLYDIKTLNKELYDEYRTVKVSNN